MWRRNEQQETKNKKKKNTEKKKISENENENVWKHIEADARTHTSDTRTFKSVRFGFLGAISEKYK